MMSGTFEGMMNKILDYLLLPIRYLLWLWRAPRRLVKRRSNWRKFQDEHRDKLVEWMRTHDEGEKLPIYRDDDEEFHWVLRSSRRRLLREMKRRAKRSRGCIKD